MLKAEEAEGAPYLAGHAHRLRSTPGSLEGRFLSTPPAPLSTKSCTPCRGGIPPLDPDQVEAHHRQTPQWAIRDEARRIERTYKFRNFAEAFAFVRRAADLAEAEAIIRTSASAGAMRPCRSRRRRSKACTRTTLSWRRSSIAWPINPPTPLTIESDDRRPANRTGGRAEQRADPGGPETRSAE